MQLKLNSLLSISCIALASCASMTSYEYSNEADANIAKGDLAAAVESYSGAISKAPSQNDVQYYVGKRAKLRERMNDPQGSLKDYDGLIASTRIDALKVDFLQQRGRIKSEMKDSAGALADFAQAVELNDKLPESNDKKVQHAKILMARAKTYEMQSKTMDEMADYAAAATLVKPNPMFADDVGKQARDGLINAIARFEQQSEKIESSQHPEAYQSYQTGLRMAREKDYFGAIGPLSDAIKASPNFDQYYFWRSIAAVGLKDYKLALSDAENALRLSPYHSNYFYSRSIAREMLGKLDDALVDINRAILIGPFSSDYQKERDDVLEKLEQRDHPEAYALYLSAIKKHTDKNYAGAIADLTAAIKLSPKYPDYYWRRAVSESWGASTGYVGRWIDDCVKAHILENRARYWSTKAHGYLARAASYEYLSLNMANDYSDARYAFKQAAELDPANAEDWMAKSRDAEYRSKDTENRVRYPSSYTAQRSAPAAPTTTTVNLLRDKSRSRFLHDYVVIFSCSSTKDKRRYEVTAGDQGEATNLAREDMHRSQWCGYNESFESATQVQ